MAELLELASRLNQRTIYDAHYLALAETLDCEQWTTDGEILPSGEPVAESVRWMGEFVKPGQ